MERSKSSGIIKSASALLAVVIIVVVILLVNQKRRLDEHRRALLKEGIDYNYTYDTRLDNFMKYADKEAAKLYEAVAVRQSDYDRYSVEEYGMAHVSMWDISSLSPESYEYFFGIGAEYADYLYTTPMELKDYFTSILDSGNKIEHLYINIDPYQLEKNYYKALYYAPEAVSFEEYIHNEIFPILDANPDTRFEFFLPARPVSYWASMSISDYGEIIEKWYDFLMYLHWCPNAEVRYMGDVEWLVSNDSNYVSWERLKDDVMQTVYTYLYAYIEYDVKPPELKQKKGTLNKYIRKYINGEYKVCDLSGQKIVFMGDSLFDYIPLDSASVPGVVHLMTSGDCYNLAIGGTTMSGMDGFGFTRVAGSIAMKSVMDYNSRYKREAERFLSEYSEDDELTFIILYGMNDYFGNIPIYEDELNEEDSAGVANEDGEEAETPVVVYTADDTFANSLRYGLETLKVAYPNARIVVLSPYRPETHDGGTIPYEDGGHTLQEYMKAVKETCTAEAVTFYDLYNLGTINKENGAEYMVDDVHATEKGAFVVGTDIANMLKEMVE